MPATEPSPSHPDGLCHRFRHDQSGRPDRRRRAIRRAAGARHADGVNPANSGSIWSLPIPEPIATTELGGTQVLVNGTAVPLFYTSYGQIAFQMPVDAPLGIALVQVQRSPDCIR